MLTTNPSWIDQAVGRETLRRYRLVFYRLASTCTFWAEPIAPPLVPLVRGAGDLRHCLPLFAWVVGIDRDEDLGQPARLLRVHQNPLGRLYEIGDMSVAIQQEEAAREIGGLDADFAVRDIDLAGALADQVRRKLLCRAQGARQC